MNCAMCLIVFLSLLLPELVIFASAHAGATKSYAIYYQTGERVYSIGIASGGACSRPAMIFDLRSLPKIKASQRSVCDASPLGAPYLIGGAPSGIYVQNGLSVWRIAQGKARKLFSNADEASLSPDGKKIAFIRARGDTADIWLADVKTLASRPAFRNAADPAWAAGRPELAFVQVTNDRVGDGRAEVANLKTRRIAYKTDARMNPVSSLLSPRGTYLSVNFHLSRPVTGDTVFNVETGRDITDRYSRPSSKYLPPIVEDWSADEKWILWDWRAPDPDNDGAWRADYVVSTSANGRFYRIIGEGTNAKFTSDGQCILFLHKRPRSAAARDLVLATRFSKSFRVLAEDVDGYVLSNSSRN